MTDLSTEIEETYICCICHETFNKGWSDEEAAAEAETLHPGLPLNEQNLACDDCFASLQNRGIVPTGPEPWWYFSFVDAKLPKGTQFLGACIVQAKTFTEALDKTWILGINPGGEAAFIEVPEEALKNLPGWDMRYKLLSREEAESI